MREYQAKSGRLIYYASRHELEALPGYRGNDRRGRACCPIHQGNNPTALSINWVTGWASCWACGDAWSLRVEDYPETRQLHAGVVGPDAVPARRREVKVPDPELHKPDTTVVRTQLEASITRAVGALPASPGAVYLQARGISLEVARELKIGWATSGTLAGRVVFPLCGPDGRPTSAIGRGPNDHTKPKYKALKVADGYTKTLFNGGAIAQARQSGHPLVMVEGSLDAAACVAAGLPLTVALCGAAYAHPEHFNGLQTVILALDGDAAGQDARRVLWLDLTARGVEVLLLTATTLDDCKDLGEYWQLHRTLPRQLHVCVIGPHLLGRVARRVTETLPSPADDRTEDGTAPTLREIQHRATEVMRSLQLTEEDLPADLRTEADELAAELGSGLDVLIHFVEDLLQREHALSAEDRCASWYAVGCALGNYQG